MLRWIVPVMSGDRPHRLGGVESWSIRCDPTRRPSQPSLRHVRSAAGRHRHRARRCRSCRRDSPDPCCIEACSPSAELTQLNYPYSPKEACRRGRHRSLIPNFRSQHQSRVSARRRERRQRERRQTPGRAGPRCGIADSLGVPHPRLHAGRQVGSLS